jgi:kinesin family protein 3/17
MNSQVLIGGNKLEETPQFISALEERKSILSKEFDSKIQEFEKERQQIKEDKAQVEHYKKFLSQLKDIMITMTARLNERNETIDQLHEEIEAYDKINKDLEDVIELKNYTIEKMEDIMKKYKLNLPNEILEYVKNFFYNKEQ